MSQRQKPPRQSPDGRGPKVVRTHAGIKSVGTHRTKGRRGSHWPDREPQKPGAQARPENGAPGSMRAPGAGGNPTTGAIGPGGPIGSA